MNSQDNIPFDNLEDYLCNWLGELMWEFDNCTWVTGSHHDRMMVGVKINACRWMLGLSPDRSKFTRVPKDMYKIILTRILTEDPKYKIT